MQHKIPFMPANPVYAFAYVPFQKFENLYEVNCALKNGTIFKDLNIPFEKYKNNPYMTPFR